MTWIFIAGVAEKTVLPHETFSMCVKRHWYRSPSRLIQDPGLDKAECILSICCSEAAEEIYLNARIDREKLQAGNVDPALGVAWATRWSDGKVGIVFGFSAERLALIRPVLDMAMTDSNLLFRISTWGGFSISDDNPYSHAPSPEQFAHGHPLPLSPDIRLVAFRRNHEND